MIHVLSACEGCVCEFAANGIAANKQAPIPYIIFCGLIIIRIDLAKVGHYVHELVHGIISIEYTQQL